MIQFDSKMSVKLIKTNACDDDVAMAAWVSNGLDSEERLKNRPKVNGLINFLYREQHMSPFEHGSFTFKVDCPIFVTREFQRHRTWSYNEVSGRYTELQPRFYIPAKERPVIQQGKIGNYYFTAGTDEQYARMVIRKRHTAEVSWNSYKESLEDGIAREVARNELPLSIYTQFYASVNPRNLMQFLTLRTAPNALYEIREVASGIEEEFRRVMPITWDAYNKAKIELQQAKNYETLYNDLKAKYDALLEEIERI